MHVLHVHFNYKIRLKFTPRREIPNYEIILNIKIKLHYENTYYFLQKGHENSTYKTCNMN